MAEAYIMALNAWHGNSDMIFMRGTLRESDLYFVFHSCGLTQMGSPTKGLGMPSKFSGSGSTKPRNNGLYKASVFVWFWTPINEGKPHPS